MKRQNDNKGFTLVEVIIAVVILGIAFGPLLSNFMQSARINNKSRAELAATTMAQNIMEGMSAYKADDLLKAFETYDSSNIGLAVLPSGVECESYGEFREDTNDPFTITVDGVSGEDSIYGEIKTATETVENEDGSESTKTVISPRQIYLRDDHKYQFFVTNVKGQINANDRN